VVRSHGGAVRRLEATQITRSAPKKRCTGMKKSDRKGAAELVRRVKTIILDSGTTTAEVARHLKRMKINRYGHTNALNIAVALADTAGRHTDS